MRMSVNNVIQKDKKLILVPKYLIEKGSPTLKQKLSPLEDLMTVVESQYENNI